MKNNRTIFLGGVVIVLAAMAVYRNSLDAPFLFDDAPAIVDNTTIRHLWPPWQALNPESNGSGVSGRPLVNLSFAINYAFGELEVQGYHRVNLTLHILVSLTLWGLLRRTWRRCLARGNSAAGPDVPAGGAGLPGDAELLAFTTALLWTLHPLLTESVVCAVQRNEVMGGLFYLLTFYGFVRDTAQETSAADKSRSTPTKDAGLPRNPSGHGWLAFSWSCCLLGMASKEIVATAPLLVLLYDRAFVAGTFQAAWQRRKRYYGALTATWLLLAWLMWHNRQRGGTVGFGLGVSPWDYLLTQCRALVIYLRLSFWPHPLILDYGTGLVRHLSEVWMQGVIIVTLLVGTGVALWRRPMLGFVGACFFVILAPSSSIVPLTTQTIAEHRMYLPLACVLILVVAGLYKLLGRWVAFALFLCAVALGVTTANRNAVYLDELGIWAGSLEACPENARAYSGVGAAHYKRGEVTEAASYFAKSVQIEPGSAYNQYDLGLALGKLDRLDEAIVHLREAVRTKPLYAEAQTELGGLLVQQGKYEEALSHLEIAVAQAPDKIQVLNGLGGALVGVGRIAEAFAVFRRALAIDPRAADVRFNYALALAANARVPEAMEQYAEAIRSNGRHVQARLNFGILLAQNGREAEALVQLREAVRLKSTLAEAHANLGIVLAVAGRPEEAAACYTEALRLRPDYALAHYNFGNALLTLRRWSEAKRHFAEAVRMAPDNVAAREMLERMHDLPEELK